MRRAIRPNWCDNEFSEFLFVILMDVKPPYVIPLVISEAMSICRAKIKQTPLINRLFRSLACIVL